MMRQTLAILTFDTPGKGPLDITQTVNEWLRATEMRMGIVTLFSQHNGAGLMVKENSDPEVERDIAQWMELAVPEAGKHAMAGAPDDLAAHIRTMLTGNALTVPVADGRMMLGKWQTLVLYEHSDSARKRGVVAHFSGGG